MTIKKKLLTCIVLLFLFFLPFSPFVNVTYSKNINLNNDIDINAKSAILIEANTGQILYQKNPDIKCYPASTTKILTALVALSKENNLNKILHVSKKAIMIEPGSSSYYLSEGETISFLDALYAMLLISANDAANVIAENVSGDINRFVDEMNNYATEIGAKNSHFANPNGLHNPNHYVTAFDLSLIARQAYKNPLIRKIVSTTEYKITSASHHQKAETQIIYNINKLIRSNSKYYYPFANGMKTGYTTQAKRTLIASAKKEDIDLIAVILSSEDAFADAIKLFDFGFNNYKKEELFKANQIVGRIKVDEKNNKQVDTYIKNPQYILISNKIKDNITYHIEYTKNINLPLKKDTVVGNIYIYSYNHLISTIPVLSYEEYIPISNVAKSIQSIKKGVMWGVKIVVWVVIFVFILFFVFIIFIILSLRKKRSKLRLRTTKTIDFSVITKKTK